MTAKEKADELYVGYWYLTNDSRIAKQCALIAVDEILQAIIETESYLNSDSQTSEYKYWQEVKQEINNL